LGILHDAAMVVRNNTQLNDLGGINLNSAPLDMQIQRDENGFVFPKIDAAMLEQMNFQRLVPTITDIRTLEMPQLRMLLGMNPDGSEEDSDVGYEPQQAARPDEISRLN